MALRVLVACEFSGIVRDAFIAAGHDAVSCDLLPSETPGPHIQRDIIGVFDEMTRPGWDLIIAHPPCTYLANSGVRWLYGGKGTTPDPKRWAGDRRCDGRAVGCRVNAPERVMPIVDATWDPLRKAFVVTLPHGIALTAPTEWDVSELVRRHAPGSSVRFIRPAPWELTR